MATETADAIFHNGVIITIDDKHPTAEAVAVKDGKIIAVGKRDQVLKTANENTRKIDLAGKTMLPGFFDSHGHAWMIGFQSMTANLLPPPDGTGKDITSLIKLLQGWAAANQDAVKQIGWIVGFGYDNSQLAEQRHPTRKDLDLVSADIPILIIHQSGHLGVANSKALEIASISANTQNPKGGVFQREADGKTPNGVAEEYAFFQLVGAFGKSLNKDVNDLFGIEGTKLLASYGYTTAQEGRATQASLDALKRVADSGALKIDLVVYPDILEIPDIHPTLEYHNRLRVGGAKLTIDGSPQGKTAWLTQPYFIPPPGQDKDYRGYPAITEQQAMDAVEKAFAHNWQILVHCNGDAAIDLMIKAVKAAEAKHPNVHNRPVLIHGQTLRRDQVDEIKKLGIFPSLFPMHTFYWGDYHRDSVLGPKRAANISPTGWVLAEGMMFGTHHDAPVALPDSMRVLSATVTRRSRSGRVIGPEHRVPVATALKAMTLWPAWQHFEEKRKGSIEVGKLADLVVLSDNPLTVSEDQLANLKVMETYKEGVSVYKRDSATASAPSPAMFGVTLPNRNTHDAHNLGIRHQHGDGCFNDALSLLMHAVEQASQNE
ncbi:amidohydrolase [Microbulbifer pacificus]|uniref:Amidohydrolase n=1 Tax=Microbulbifer pacificus TaxID=407164 RepID=A0AAU0MWQ3_9GAMM|nr:amidohydrolase [Microbulbifer pacificus]WOX04422.1 amidohydrolase [Microbulbifer pacificus]